MVTRVPSLRQDSPPFQAGVSLFLALAPCSGCLLGCRRIASAGTNFVTTRRGSELDLIVKRGFQNPMRSGSVHCMRPVGLWVNRTVTIRLRHPGVPLCFETWLEQRTGLQHLLVDILRDHQFAPAWMWHAGETDVSLPIGRSCVSHHYLEIKDVLQDPKVRRTETRHLAPRQKSAKIECDEK